MSPGSGARQSQLVFKRVVDVVVSAMLIAILSPLMVLIAIAIRLNSPGPALFRQRRVGQNGVPFTLFKFRTMTVDGDDSIHRQYMEDLVRGEAEARLNDSGERVFLLDDPRVTRLGSMLRKTSLDELPNLFNVLRGDMSLVGPRPPISYEFELYDERARARLDVKPGMTGLAQVRGRGRLNFEEILEADLHYIETWSLGLDFKILLKTVPSVLGKRGV